MGNIKLAIVIMLKSILAFSFYGYSFSAIADTSVATEATDSSRFQVELIRDRDYKCVQCHKDSKETLSGSHGEDAHKILGREVNVRNVTTTLDQTTERAPPLLLNTLRRNLNKVRKKCSWTPVLS